MPSRNLQEGISHQVTNEGANVPNLNRRINLTLHVANSVHHIRSTGLDAHIRDLLHDNIVHLLNVLTNVLINILVVLLQINQQVNVKYIHLVTKDKIKLKLKLTLTTLTLFNA